jgi:DNA polymerase-4
VGRINGVGPKASQRLAALGIQTIGELARADPQMLVEAFGRSYGPWLHAAAHGQDERPVVTFSEPKSISRETTFERDLHPRRDRAQLSAIFAALCARVSEDLVRRGYTGKTIGVKLRFEDFRTLTRDHTVAQPTAQADEILRAARECLRRVRFDARLRLLGVRVGSLRRASEEPGPAAHRDHSADLFDRMAG